MPPRKRAAAADDDSDVQPFERMAANKAPKAMTQSKLNLKKESDDASAGPGGDSSDDELGDLLGAFAKPTAPKAGGGKFQAVCDTKAPKKAAAMRKLTDKKWPHALPKFGGKWQARCYVREGASAKAFSKGREEWVFSCPSKPEFGEFSGKNAEADMRDFCVRGQKEEREAKRGTAAPKAGEASSAAAAAAEGGDDADFQGSGPAASVDPLAMLLSSKKCREAEDEEMKARGARSNPSRRPPHPAARAAALRAPASPTAPRDTARLPFRPGADARARGDEGHHGHGRAFERGAHEGVQVVYCSSGERTGFGKNCFSKNERGVRAHDGARAARTLARSTS